MLYIGRFVRGTHYIRRPAARAAIACALCFALLAGCVAETEAGQGVASQLLPADSPQPTPRPLEEVLADAALLLAASDAQGFANLYGAADAEALTALASLAQDEAAARVEADIASGQFGEDTAFIDALMELTGIDLAPQRRRMAQAQDSWEAFAAAKACLDAGDYQGALDNAARVLRGYTPHDEVMALFDAAADGLAAQMAEEALNLRAAGQYEQALMKARDAADLSANASALAALEACGQPGEPFLGLTTREDYNYVIEWEPYVFDPVRPLELLRVTPMPEKDRERMERLIQLFASLYPPDYFNARVDRILCYRRFAAARLDGEDNPELDASGSLIFDTYVGATGEQHIIMTDNFDSDYDIVKALVHEFGHVQYHHPTLLSETKDAYEARIRALNPEGFTYYYEDEAITTTGDIKGWASTDRASDWAQGFARRYAMLSIDEEHSTLMEKMQLGRMPEFARYETLYAKMEAAAELICAEHPSLNAQFYLEDLPAYIKRALR